MSDVRQCSEFNCGKATREGKPYCPDHFEQNTYAAIVLAGIETMKEETEAASKRRNPRVKHKGLLVEEVLAKLWALNGCGSVDAVAKNTRMDTALVERVFKVLARQKRIRLARTNRGKLMARVIGEVGGQQ